MVLTGVLSNPEFQEKIARLARIAGKQEGRQAAIPGSPKHETPISELLVALMASVGEPMRVVEIHSAAEVALGRAVSMSTIKNQLARDFQDERIQRIGRGRYATPGYRAIPQGRLRDRMPTPVPSESPANCRPRLRMSP